MSSTQEGSSGLQNRGRKTGGTRRSWTENEEAVLIAAVKDLLVKGWKSDNGFRAGYLTKLEEAMKNHWPETDIKATPHISSKLSTWKKNYYSLQQITAQSGVGFNSTGNFKLDVLDQAWEGIIKADSNARNMRYKSWPYYDDWKEIFGRDRANGNGAEDIPDAWNDIRTQDYTDDVGTGDDYNVSLEDLAETEGNNDNMSHTERPTQLPRTNNNSKKRKASAVSVSDEVSNLCDVLMDFGKKTDAHLASLVDSISYESRLGQAAEDAFDELGKIDGLSIDQRFDVCEILAANVDKVKIFKGLSGDARAQFVKRLLGSKGK